jgi:hypothetical protein
VPKLDQRYVCHDQLSCHPVPTVNHIRDRIDEYHLRRGRPHFIGAWTAGGTKKDQSGRGQFFFRGDSTLASLGPPCLAGQESLPRNQGRNSSCNKRAARDLVYESSFPRNFAPESKERRTRSQLFNGANALIIPVPDRLNPPSTEIICPVMKSDFSATRN